LRCTGGTLLTIGIGLRTGFQNGEHGDRSERSRAPSR
jgi:hypothetical protein